MDPDLAERAAAMRQALAAANADDVPTTCLLGHGPNLADTVLAHARSTPAEIIMLGTHGEGLFDGEQPARNARLGSLAAGMIQHATCPVLFIPEADSNPSIRRILVHVDLSQHTCDVVRLASALATRFGAALDLLHVTTSAPQHAPVPTVRPEEDVRRRLLDSCVDAAQEEGPGAAVPEVAFYSRTGYAPTVLSEFAREHESDLLLLVAPGLPNAEHNALEAERERVVHHVPCPVLTVHASGHSLLEPEAAATARPALSSLA